MTSPYSEKVVSTVSDKLAEGIRALSNNQLSLINGLSKGKGNNVQPDYLLNFSQELTGQLTNLSLMLIDTIDRLVPHIGPWDKQGINMINAFYCGLWDALVESVVGVIDLVAYLIKGFGMVGLASKKSLALVAQGLKAINSLIQMVINADWPQIIQQVKDTIITEILQIDLATFTSLLSLEKTAYFFGYLIGFAMEYLVAAFSSAGLNNVRLAQKVFGELGESLGDYLQSEFQSITGKREGFFSLEGMIALVQKSKSVLDDGGQELSEMLKALWGKTEIQEI